MPAARRVIHVLSAPLHRANAMFIGSVKDFSGRTEYFRDRQFDVVKVGQGTETDEEMLEKIEAVKPNNFDFAFFENVHWPRCVAELRRRHPHIRIVVRSINAEFIHMFHRWRASRLEQARSGQWMPSQVVEHIGQAFRRLYSEYQSARYADVVASICDWEAERYWYWIAGTRKVVSVPFFLADAHTSSVAKAEQRLPRCVCLTAAKIGPIIQDAAWNFYEQVDALGTQAPEWEFVITGSLEKTSLPTNPRVHRTGNLSDPVAALAGASASALLSDLGMGFKTKILDGAVQGAYTLVPPSLYRRLPENLKPFCIAVDLNVPGAFLEALQKSRHPLPEFDVNRVFRNQAFAALDRIFGIE